jgi:hypothetical protein
MKIFILLNLIFISINSESIDTFLKDKVFLKSLLKNNSELLRINKEIREIKVKIESIKLQYKFTYSKDNYLMSLDKNETKINEIQVDKKEIIASQEKDIEILLRNIEMIKSELNDLLEKNPLEIYPNLAIPESLEIPTILDKEKLKLKDGIVQQFEELAFLSKEIRNIGSELKYQSKLLKDKKSPNRPIIAEKEDGDDFQWEYFGKSFVFPYWGHKDSESQWKKYVYSSLFILCTINAIEKYNEFNHSAKEYKSFNPLIYDVILSGKVDNNSIYYLKNNTYLLLKNNLQDSASNGNNSIYLLLFVSLWSAFDAGTSNHNSIEKNGVNFTSKIEKLYSNQYETIFNLNYIWRN